MIVSVKVAFLREYYCEMCKPDLSNWQWDSFLLLNQQIIIQELSGLTELLNCHQTHLSLTSTTSASVHCLKMDGSTFLKVKKRPGKTTTPQINTCNILSRYKTWSDVWSKTRYPVKIAALSRCGQGSIRAAVPLPQQRSLYCTNTNNGGGVRWLIALHSCFTSRD